MIQTPHALQAAPTTASTEALVRRVATQIFAPKLSRTSSFVLHAPMELLARAALLPMVAPSQLEAARQRIAQIALDYAEGDEVGAPTASFESVGAALRALAAAIDAGDADSADAAVCWLAPRASALEIATVLADVVAPLLGAAAHAPILFGLLPAANRAFGDLNLLLRGPVRALAMQSGLRLTWLGATGANGPADLCDALTAGPATASPSPFIAPTMLTVQASAEACLARATGAIEPSAAARTMTRLAAQLMLTADPAHAHYGWSHALTMPQGMMALAPLAQDPRACVRAAATYLFGFRATLGASPVDPDWRPARVRRTVGELVTRAATHHDAHLAKYTLACLQAAEDDPAEGNLYLAAAEYLGDWWEAHPDAGFYG